MTITALKGWTLCLFLGNLPRKSKAFSIEFTVMF